MMIIIVIIIIIICFGMLKTQSATIISMISSLKVNIYYQELLSSFAKITNSEALVQRHSYKLFFWKVKKICNNASVKGYLFSRYVIGMAAPFFRGCPENFLKFSEQQFQVKIDIVLLLVKNYGKFQC